MIAALIETYFFIERAELTVDARADESVASQFGQLLFEFSFAAANNRGQDHHSLAFRQREHVMQNLLDALAGDGGAALVTMGQANRREKQTQIIVNLGDRADG